MSRTNAEIDPKPDEILQLGTHRFSLRTRVLQDADGQAVTLRSQSAEVLGYLADHAGTLVSKDALIEAVWADTFVTDDSLVQCIGDIRRALGDDDHSIVQTFPKKGYKLVATPVVVPEAAVPVPRRWALPAFGAVAVAVLIGLYVWLSVGPPAPVHPPGDKPRIAVLPFDDFSAGDDQGYLSDAIAEGVITELARNRTIVVIARNSSFQYRDSATDVRAIGEELGIHYLLEGSQQKSGDQLKVTVQLINAANGEHLWAHTYDQEIGDLFVVQDNIIRTVADRIGDRIERPLPVHDPDKVTALYYHLKAKEAIQSEFNADNNAKMFEYGEKAIEVDPDAHYGYLTLAFANRHAATFGWHGLDDDAALAAGFANGRKALELGPDDPTVYYALARLHNEAGEIEQSLARFTQAIEMNPSASRYLVASTSPLLMRGDTEPAIERLKQAMGIDPHHPDWYHWQMGWALWEIEACDAALASFQRMKLIPKGAHRMLAGVYACLGQVEKAQEAYQVFYSESDEPTISEQREAWKDEWTAPGSLERFLEHMRIAGMKD